MVLHFLGRLGRHETEKPAHLFADRVALLLLCPRRGRGGLSRGFVGSGIFMFEPVSLSFFLG
jgi:hypothetical protein